MNATFQAALNRHFGPRFIRALPAQPDAVEQFLSTVDGRNAYAPSHPGYSLADDATRDLLDAITNSERLLDDLLALIAHGASLRGLEVDPGSADAALQKLARDAAQSLVDEGVV